MERWPDLEQAISFFARISLSAAYESAFDATISARKEFPAPDSDEESDSDTDNDLQYGGGVGPLVLSGPFMNLLLRETVVAQQLNFTNAILAADTDAPVEERRLIMLGLSDASRCAATHGDAAAFASLLASISSRDRGIVESVIQNALSTAIAVNGKHAFAGTMANMLLTRFKRAQTAFLAEKEAGRLSQAAEAEMQVVLAQRSDRLKNVLINSFTAGCKTDEGAKAVQSLLDVPDISSLLDLKQVAAAVLKPAAMNGKADVLELLVDRQLATSEDLCDLFGEATRRGYDESLRALLSLPNAAQLFDKDYLTYHREQAYLREKDQAVGIIDEAMARFGYAR